MITITFTNGTTKTYLPEAFTDYEYRKEVFIVIKGNQWVGIYSMDYVKSIEYEG